MVILCFSILLDNYGFPIFSAYSSLHIVAQDEISVTLSPLLLFNQKPLFWIICHYTRVDNLILYATSCGDPNDRPTPPEVLQITTNASMSQEGYIKQVHGIRKYLVLLIVVILVLTISIGIVAFILGGGLIPNINKGSSYSTLVIPLPPPSPKSIPSTDLGTIKGIVVGPTGLPAIGATILAYKEIGLLNSAVKKGGFTKSSFVFIDGGYSLKVPSGIYRITVAFPDGTDKIVENYAVWPSSLSSYDFNY